MEVLLFLVIPPVCITFSEPFLNLNPTTNTSSMALSDGASNLISQAVSQAILQVNATREAAHLLPLTDLQIRTALATSFASLLPAT
jgi:hypothetical protein